MATSEDRGPQKWRSYKIEEVSPHSGVFTIRICRQPSLQFNVSVALAYPQISWKNCRASEKRLAKELERDGVFSQGGWSRVPAAGSRRNRRFGFLLALLRRLARTPVTSWDPPSRLAPRNVLKARKRNLRQLAWVEQRFSSQCNFRLCSQQSHIANTNTNRSYAHLFTDFYQIDYLFSEPFSVFYEINGFLYYRIVFPAILTSKDISNEKN